MANGFGNVLLVLAATNLVISFLKLTASELLTAPFVGNTGYGGVDMIYQCTTDSNWKADFR